MNIQNPDTQRIHRFNLRLLSTVNIHRVATGQFVQCHHYDEIFGCGCDKTLDRAVKAGFVLIPFEKVKDLDEDSLKMICEVDGLLIP